MIDCFDGQVVSWTIGTRPDAELVNTMLDAAIETFPADSERPVVHSDRGAHLRFKESSQHRSVERWILVCSCIPLFALPIQHLHS